MQLEFHLLTEREARMIATWQYPEPYSIYGFSDEFTGAPGDDGSRFYAVTDAGELIGFRSFGKDGRVPGGTYDDDYLDTGGGLRPDLTGKGLGRDIIRQGLQFGAREFETSRFRVTVAAFNKRARSVIGRIGFQETQRFKRPRDQMEFIIYTIDLNGKDAQLNQSKDKTWT